MAWTDFLSDIDWGGVAIQAIPAIYGASVAADANKQAAQTLANSAQQSAQQITAGNTAATQALTDSNAKAQQRLADVADRSAPAVQYLRTVMSDQTLTPGQQQRINETRQQTGQLLSNRVGGRSATAIATKAAQNLENSIYDANRTRSDSAAGVLAGQNTAAINAAAGQDINLGNNVARIATGQGSALAGITADTGQNTANAGLATAKTQGQLAGDVMSAIRSASAEDRKSSYDNWKSGAG